ncbi:MAG: hypothetical protein IKN47_04820 [Lachnospiraceae bacterium]|nr:hypothetical protein [Lachnospiraceae bacterium]
MIRFEKDHLLIEPLISAMFLKKMKIEYDKIDRIEFPKGDIVYFYLKDGKVKKVENPAIVALYPQFGEMLRDHRIAYRTRFDDKGYESVESVRKKASITKECAIEYANRSLSSSLGPEYEMEGKIVERIIGTTIEFRLLKNGVVVKEANVMDSIEGIPLIDEMDLAYLSEWDPESNTGLYLLEEEANSTAECESYMEEMVLKEVYDLFKEQKNDH